MKTIGLVGGMSWESTAGYYQIINETVKAQLGGLHSAKIAMVSVDFAPIEVMQHEGDWAGTAKALAAAAQQVEAASADCLLVCTNTMHIVANEIQDSIGIPLLHIADATGEVLQDADCRKVGLLGTAFTMQQDFYKGRLKEKFDLEVIVPGAEDQALVHHVIYEELCLGKINPDSKDQYLKIIDRLAIAGAETVILGCTEIAMLVSQSDTEMRLIDTTRIHAEKAVEFALKAE